MKDPLKKHVIAASGTFSREHSISNMKRWVENAGGQWSNTISDGVTHLIVDEIHWKEPSASVKDAKARGNIHIVTYDWLEDSLMKQYPYASKKYLWTTVEKAKQANKSTRKKREKKEESEEVKEFKKGVAAAKRDLQSGRSDESSADEATSKDRGAGSARGTGRGRGRARGRGTGRGSNRGADKAGKKGNPTTRSHPEPTSDDKLQSRESRPESASPKPTQTRSSSSPSPTPIQPHDSSVQKLAAFRAAAVAQRSKLLIQKIRSNLSSFDSPTDNYHVYVDQTGFAHNITLTRVNILANTSERIELSLYESDFEKTKFYAVHIAYNGPSGAEEKKILVNPGANFDDAFQMFRAAFKRVCIIPWEQRLFGDSVHRQHFKHMEMHKRRCKEMERFGEIFTIEKPDGTVVDPQKPWLNDDEGSEEEKEEAGAGGKRKRGDDEGRTRKKRKKNDDNDGPKRLSAEDLKACCVNPFKYAPPPNGRPRGMMAPFGVVIGGDDMKADQEFLTLPNI